MFKLALKFYLRFTLTQPLPAACRGRQHFHCFHSLTNLHMLFITFCTIDYGIYILRHSLFELTGWNLQFCSEFGVYNKNK